MTHPRPTIQKDAAGARRLVGRRFGQARGAVVHCPEGHRLEDRRRWGDMHYPLKCLHSSREARLGEHTGHWLYLLPDLDGRTLVVECSFDEVQHIERARLTLTEIRGYLGVTDARAA